MSYNGRHSKERKQHSTDSSRGRVGTGPLSVGRYKDPPADNKACPGGMVGDNSRLADGRGGSLYSEEAGHSQVVTGAESLVGEGDFPIGEGESRAYGGDLLEDGDGSLVSVHGSQSGGGEQP